METKKAENHKATVSPRQLGGSEIMALVLALIYATSWREGKGVLSALRSWRSYDWTALDSLMDAGLIAFNRKNKSVWITDEGENAARALIETLSIDDDLLDDASSDHAEKQSQNIASSKA